CLLSPIAHCALIQFIGSHGSLQRTSVSKQSHYYSEQLFILVQPIIGCTFAGCESLVTLFAFITLLFLAVYNNIAFAYLSSSRIGQSAAKFFWRVHPPIFLLVSSPKRIKDGPLFFNFYLLHGLMWRYHPTH